ncbi:uncharacterized protein LOC101894541 isoform X2 [Musca domestica]|uniref:Fruit protein pKIWI501 isoform X2 n=1 Tax=Musca domestica TaxID=7370 RepID=A0A1I8MD23_MUSDO|nr:uncharacterized protein LOC101894541 isoform X2 [Musca domestica]
MKFSLALIAVVALVAGASTLPAKKRMVYYQQPAAYYTAPQRMMYVQYVQPARPFARSTQAAEALVAGETVATGTYLKEADVAAAGPAVDVSAERGEDVLSEAEAYPASGEAVPVVPVAAVPAEVDIVAEENEVAAADEAAKVPRDYNFEAAEESAAAAAAGSAEEATYEAEQGAGAEAPAVEAEAPVAAELPAPAPIAPVAKPARRYLPSKKKVYVELEQSVEDEADADEEVEYEVPVAPARRPAAKKPAKAPTAGTKAEKPLPAGTFFPINFGGTSGGAIAIANSFSTGEGGSATSHAIAYGSPDSVRARVRPGKFH